MHLGTALLNARTAAVIVIWMGIRDSGMLLGVNLPQYSDSLLQSAMHHALAPLCQEVFPFLLLSAFSLHYVELVGSAPFDWNGGVAKRTLIGATNEERRCYAKEMIARLGGRACVSVSDGECFLSQMLRCPL